MTAEAIPKIHTDDLPMPEARDEAWLIVGRSPIVELEDGYAVTTRDLVETVLKDPATFSSKKAFDVLASPVPLVPIAFDPPQQTRYRQILQPFFSPGQLSRLNPN
ncbi:putative cytochrome P450 [Mycobacterium xenopi 4042]|uniref:Putative cytochrome P450 n=1 Tax=Mycobacterium xenopi 4042 TaxID=1299334 RepID=X8AHI7_MYCXE|nr:putative cytochrome P450 [Mycobacterium xenopi 4042]